MRDMTDSDKFGLRERRRTERFELRIPGSVKSLAPIPKGANEDVATLTTTDISSGGAFFHTANPLPEGTEVEVDMILTIDKLKQLKKRHDRTLIAVRGTVLRAGGNGMAVRFNRRYRMRPLREKSSSTGH